MPRQKFYTQEHDRAASVYPGARLITADTADGNGNAVQWRAP
jgi:hypothetical protein